MILTACVRVSATQNACLRECFAASPRTNPSTRDCVSVTTGICAVRGSLTACTGASHAAKVRRRFTEYYSLSDAARGPASVSPKPSWTNTFFFNFAKVLLWHRYHNDYSLIGRALIHAMVDTPSGYLVMFVLADTWTKRRQRACVPLSSPTNYTALHRAQCVCLATAECVGVALRQKVFGLCSRTTPTSLPNRSVYVPAGVYKYVYV